MSKQADLRGFVRELSDEDLSYLSRLCHKELRARAEELGDPQYLIQKVMDDGFTITGEPIPPRGMGNGIVAITGVVKDTSSIKHTCTLYTIRSSEDDAEEHWMWEDSASTYIDSETVKVDKIRRTVTLHAPADGALIIEHKMRWDGSRHERLSVKGYVVRHEHNEEGEIVGTEFDKPSMSVLKRLPPPPSDSV